MSDRIAQSDLRSVLVLKSEVSSLRRNLKREEQNLKELKASIVERLRSGVPIRSGRLSAEAVEKDRANHLSYDRLEEILGAEITSQIKEVMGSTSKFDLEISESE